MRPNYPTFLKTIVAEFVSHPKAIQVQHRSEGTRGQVSYVELTVHGSDMGKVLGKDGAMHRALLALVLFYGGRMGDHVAFTIAEPASSEPVERLPDRDDEWTRTDDVMLVGTFDHILEMLFGHDRFHLGWEACEDRPRTDFWFVNDKVPVELRNSLNTVFVAISRARGRRIKLSTMEAKT